MEEAGLPFGEGARQQDLVGLKQRQGVQVAPAEQGLARVVDASPRMVLVEDGRYVDVPRAPPRPDAQIDPGPVFTIDGPGRPAINFLPQVIPPEFRQLEVMAQRDHIRRRTLRLERVELRIEGIFLKRNVGIHADRHIGDAEKTAVMSAPVFLV